MLSVFPKKNLTSDLEDCALIWEKIGVTIDSFTVSPRDFPGGDIGELAICGSANDLAVRGVKPQFITMSVVAEEGLHIDELTRYMKSASSICQKLGIQLVAGDTKVVPKGHVEGLFITTCAVGERVTPAPLGMNLLQPGDTIIVSTSIGRHGAAIGASRFDLNPEDLKSDCAPLWPALEPLLKIDGLRCMRDCTRGGLGTVMCEWAEGRQLGVTLSEEGIPIRSSVQSVCDILGFDPLYLACEGCAAIGVDPKDTDKVLNILRENPLCQEASIIGSVTEEHKGMVALQTKIGGMRVVDMPVGEMLPRIC
ncbi:MAG: hydrogenase expression/formation protein HypE [Aminobacterium sp.]|uniref:hydrogenase expression/formation protein HypE n=1 Tax=Aminobacterium sp. TaxID=1872491 RepID=UPI002B22141A|nr:hydrogenase expression/formation protein HypE [Aminobacterium sp.]MEA4876412.1 hydrogenase expression/formation protein HypE [Aminobacterium sp.]